MKVVITAESDQLSGPVDRRFGRARWLLLVDTETGDFSAHSNDQNLNAAQGAGIQTGQNVAELGCEAVITGNVGPNAFRTLEAAGIKAYLAEGKTAQAALDMFKDGKLKQSDQANVEGHWV